MNLEELPGAELILPSLEDLQKGKADTVSALLITIASKRLTKAGLKIPKMNLLSDSELRLYACLQHGRDDAYAYYNALLERLHSFCNAIEQAQRTDYTR